ncbi:hypothetical protein KOI35_07960 [Actinoplanes bogorensis]|uniref:Ig-like domain repeat protein n=1 Tax=Paractinoplanes bogorensis TaxID=1610840 RepID=A0ABS5YL52_9ACTN|nr:hypothetical protein [Actinoplanes bogorensis]MBU2663438.1 hypothetical protein [Actinoplanes bogorensis]
MKSARAVIAATVLAGVTGTLFYVVTGTATAETVPVQVTAPPARKTTAKFTSVDRVIVDKAHRRVLVSDPSAGKVVALNYDGTTAATATGLTQVNGLALSADSNTVYAAVRDEASIVALRADTLAEIKTFPVYGSPTELVRAGSRLWYAARGGVFGVLDLATGEARAHEFEDLNPWEGMNDLLIAVSPTNPNLLAVTTGPGITSGAIALFDTSGTTERQIAYRSNLNFDYVINFRDLRFTADGATLMVAGEKGIAYLSATDLAVTGNKAMNSSVALDVASNGWFATANGGPYSVSVQFVPAGSTTHTRVMELSAGGGLSGMAWEPGGARLAALTVSTLGESSLYVVEEPTKDVPAPLLTPSLTLTPSAVYAYGTTATFTATLGKTATNRVVEIWADPAGTDQPNRLLKRATADKAGKVSTTFKLTRTTNIVAKFTGDAGYQARSVIAYARTRVSASTALTRHYKTAKMGTLSYQYFRSSADPLVTQTMTAATNRKVRTTIEVWSGSKWVLWSGRDTKLSSAGKASFTFVTGAKVGKKFRVRADYVTGTSGDSLNYTTAGAWKYFTYTK